MGLRTGYLRFNFHGDLGGGWAGVGILGDGWRGEGPGIYVLAKHRRILRYRPGRGTFLGLVSGIVIIGDPEREVGELVEMAGRVKLLCAALRCDNDQRKVIDLG